MQQPAPSAHDHIQAFRDAMAAADLVYNGPIDADGKLHRVCAGTDKRGVRNSWYVLHLDGRPAGAFGTWKGMTTKWSAEGMAPLSNDERRQIAEQARQKAAREAAASARLAAEAAVAATAMWDAAELVVEHPYLERKGVPGYGLRVGTWVKESAPDAVTGEIKTRRFANALLIPLRDETRAILSLQAVFAEPIGIGGSKRDKDFVYGGRKKGCWFTIGAPLEIDGVQTVGICEGYATGASVHRATGLGVVVAFDAGNLLAVAQTVRSLMPDARIVFLADNDQWTKKQDGSPWNVGVERATEAAAEVGGMVAVPWFKAVDDKPSDWNDLDKAAGLDEVRRQVMNVISPPASEPAEAPPHDSVPDHSEYTDYVDPDADDGSMPRSAEDVDDTDLENSAAGFFRILGHDRDSIYIYHRAMKMIINRGMTDWGETALIMLAPTNWWEMNGFKGGKNGGIDTKFAYEWIMRTAERRGFFDPSCRRGRGAWMDAGRIVYHFGDRLMIDGALQKDLTIKSSFVYEQAARMPLPADDPMSSADGKLILEAAKLFHWTRPASSILIAGWVALAPICGALRWRPHVWLTGGAGSGKTTVLNDFLMALLNGCPIYAQGNSTEAGIRQKLKTDALPVIFDETEQNNEREAMRVQSVLALVRQASTESAAQTLKGTQGGEAQTFHIRSMFCLSSIQVGMKHQADYERLTILALRPKREGEDQGAAALAWAKISAGIAALKADPELPARLMRRSLALLPITIQNVEIFAQAAAEAFGSQREGDQYGALLAGAWSLFSSKLATLEQARELIARYNWDEYRENSETEESQKALSVLLSKMIRLPRGGADVNVYELVCAAANKPADTCEIDAKMAEPILMRYGLKIKWADNLKQREDAHLLIAFNHSEMERLLADTPYAADIKGQLLRVPGAERHKTERFGAVSSRCVALPLSAVVEGVEARMPGEDDPRFSDDFAF